jgi:predicted SprT family Zn-dependent metalloprotease
VPGSQQAAQPPVENLRLVLPDTAALQLLFAELNYAHFNGEVPSYRIGYNERFANLAGRITYKPPLIELSPKHFRKHPEALRETLLHEMIHAWLHARGKDPGHTPAFKKKMRELGLSSIYHDLGAVVPFDESATRFILRCDRCGTEMLRKRKPPRDASCGRCSRRKYDARYPLRVFETTGLRELERPEAATAANGRPRRWFRQT